MALREIVSRLFRKTPQKKESEGAGVLSQKDYDAKYGKYILARGILGDKKLELIDFRNVKRKILGGLLEPSLYISIEPVSEREYFNQDFLGPNMFHYFHLLWHEHP